MKNQTKWGILLGVTSLAIWVVFLLPAIPQNQNYHHFADTGMIRGIPRCRDVVSNIAFLLVAFLGFRELRRQWVLNLFDDKREVIPYLFFFLGVFLTGFGSAYYHWAPNNARLVWDRAPMTIIVMSLVSIILTEKISAKIGFWSLGPLLALGFSSVLYWKWTESLGRGDLSFYGFVLFYPIVLIPLILCFFPKPFPAANELIRLAIYYGLSKFFEAKDAAVYEVTGIISGHTLKHLLAAFSLYWIVKMLQKRKDKATPVWTIGKSSKIVLLILGLVLLGVVWFIRSVIAMPGDTDKWITQRWIPYEEKGLQQRLEHHVDVLARQIGIRNCQDPQAYKGLEKSADYIGSIWKSQGYKVQEQSYDVGREVKNLFIEKRGIANPDEIIVIGAHYDGVEDGPAANDNGLGVAALLEISGYLSRFPTARTVQLVAFVNEEPPFFQTETMGSRVYASDLGIHQKNVVGMISLETIGCYSNKKGCQQYPWPFSAFYPDTGNFITFVGNYGSREWVRICVGTFRKECIFHSEGIAAPGFIQGIGWSDHWSFWQEGYPALMVTDTAPYRYKYYHTAQDTLDKIDFVSMALVVEGLEKTVLRLAQ